MKYQEIQDEYISLLQEKTACQNILVELRSGYISVKTISNKKYTYLQYRWDGKLISEYIREDDLPKIRAELDERAKHTKRICEIDDRLGKIEAAANILDCSLHRKLITFRRCAVMESMPLQERSKSLAFGGAMAALEGIPVSRSTEHNLKRWAEGKYSFQESFLNTLRAFNLAEV